MRKLLIILFFPIIAIGQPAGMTKMLIGPFAAFHGFHNGQKIPLYFHQPPDATATLNGTGVVGKKYPVVIDVHGQGEVTANYPDMATIGTGDLDDLFSNGMPQYLRFTTSAYYGKRYAAPGRTDSTQFFYVFPQYWQGYVVAPVPSVLYNTLTWLVANYSNIIDTNRIYITGLSYGGYAVWFGLQFSEISRWVAAAIAHCPGGLTIGGYTPAYNFQNIASWGGFILAIHSLNDPVTNSGSLYSDRAVDSVLKYKGRTTVVYRKRTVATHNVWDPTWNPTQANTTLELLNQNTFNNAIPWQSRLLAWSKAGRTKN